MTNAHESTDHAHVAVDTIIDRAKRELHEAVQAMYEEQKRLADQRRHHSDIVARINGFIGLYDCVVAGQPVDEAVLTVLDEQRAEIVRLRRIARLARRYNSRGYGIENGTLRAELDDALRADDEARSALPQRGPYHDVDTADLAGGDTA